MNTILGWGLAAIGIAMGYALYGWRGVLLALSGVVFWLLLQFSRAARALRAASAGPVGVVRNAVALNARLHQGMRLMEILTETHSLGVKIAVTGDSDEAFAWRDPAGDAVSVSLKGGRLIGWHLSRAAGDDAAPAPDHAP